jgi:hypothetical protein
MCQVRVPHCVWHRVLTSPPLPPAHTPSCAYPGSPSQEYIQLARSGDARGPAARLPYHFVFYLQGGAGGEAAAARPHVAAEPQRPSSSTLPGLTRVALSLPPPAIGPPGAPRAPRRGPPIA